MARLSPVRFRRQGWTSGGCRYWVYVLTTISQR